MGRKGEKHRLKHPDFSGKNLKFGVWRRKEGY
jgi:hypothetical protein